MLGCGHMPVASGRVAGLVAGSYPGRMRGRPGMRVPRALAVLAVLLGVLAMHGLATSHHGAATAPFATAALTAVENDGHAHADAATAVADVVPAGHDCDGACQGGEHALALLCLAVLLAAGLGVLVLRQRTGPLPARTGSPQRMRARAPAPPRSFDPVTELCVSRT